MNRLLLLPFAVPFACLAILSSIALVGVVVIGGAIGAAGAIRSVMGLGTYRQDHPWDRMVGDAHPLDYVEGQPG